MRVTLSAGGDIFKPRLCSFAEIKASIGLAAGTAGTTGRVIFWNAQCFFCAGVNGSVEVTLAAVRLAANSAQAARQVIFMDAAHLSRADTCTYL
jgi:hypothetical protein